MVVMNPRLAALAALCREVAIPASVLASIAAFGSAGIDNTGAAPIVERPAPSFTAVGKFADKLTPISSVAADAVAASRSLTVAAGAEATPASHEPEPVVTAASTVSSEMLPPETSPQQVASADAADAVAASRSVTETAAAEVTPASHEPEPIVTAASTVSSEMLSPETSPQQVASAAAADAVAASRSVTETATAEVTPASHEPEPIVTAALTDSSEMLAPETSPDQVAKSLATREPGDAHPAVDSTEVLGECLVVDPCIDRYLWVIYQRTPKEDAVKTQEQRKVTVKKKGRLVTVTRTFTTLADEDFSWKDPKAAEKAGMPMVDYVIGGMDRDFKLKLFHMLHAAEQAGLSPGITSAFRDDYRQSIATGLKAANDRSYHGGSFRGGYGHGLAADMVSVNGATRAQRFASTETFWKWIDAHGQEFGIGRPYLDRDPPHVAPIDGKEYADHHPGMRARAEAAAPKPRGRLTVQNHRSSTKVARTAKSSKMRTIRPA
jgi:D-alanyl-D-alanine carboxypeptidase